VIRPATPDDARAIAELHVRAAYRAYGDFLDPGELPTVDEREAQWRAGVPGAESFVFDQDGQVSGVVAVDPEELRVLYVDPPAQGAGVGTALHDHAVAWLRARGATHATLWVFTPNGHGRHFWEARGWTPDGATGELRGVPTLRYAREL
jgi:GNAT superfamily N-acetyltransferase